MELSMDTLFMGGMATGCVFEGIDDVKKAADIEKQIASVQQTTANLQAQYSKINQESSYTLSSWISDIQKGQAEILDLGAQLRAYKKKFQATMIRMSIMGVLMVTFVFYSLFFKLFLPKGGLIKLIKGAFS